MHLKSLTLRGFKSFASTTVLRFEPGITCVVGPNGSGKSNVVDALAWVMGEQGAKTLRGGKMEDVVFAGTSGRPPLGRAEVSLTIDNTDGALPIDYTEVTVTRTMFRAGGSEYAINGAPVRLLDVQELLADSGIGREMHVVVGQGSLDAVLSAGPENRRGFLEEAAGVLKHRRRKEKALRKLEAMQANLTRLQDLTAELRRQLKPLGRQAELARRAADVQAELRDARARLLADDLVEQVAELERGVADEAAARTRREALEATLGKLREQRAALEQAALEAVPHAAAASETYYRLASLRERVHGSAGLAAERLRFLDAEAAREEHDVQAARTRQDPEQLEREAEQARARERELLAVLARERRACEAAVESRQGSEAELAAEERRIAAAARAAADRREQLARLVGQVGAQRSRVEAGEAERGRIAAALEEARVRAQAASSRVAAAEEQMPGLGARRKLLDAEHARVAAALAEAHARVAARRDEDRAAERERAAAAARVEALELGIARREDAAAALLAAGDRVPGVLGPLAGLLDVRPGYETAVAAALGAAADAVAVADVAAALAAVRLARERNAGRVSLMVAGTGQVPLPGLPPGACRALDVVRVPDALRGPVGRLLAAVVVADTLEDAHGLVAGEPSLRAVTRDGEVLGHDLAAGGSGSGPSSLEVQAALDAARAQLAGADKQAQRLRQELAAALDAESRAAAAAETALGRSREAEASRTAAAAELGRLGASARAAEAEAERLARALAGAEAALDGQRVALRGLEERLSAADRAASRADDLVAAADAPDAPDATGGGPGDRDGRQALAAACAAARSAEVEARLAVRTAEERVRALAGRADALGRAAARERDLRARTEARRQRRTAETSVARAVGRGATIVLARLEASLAAAAAERATAEEARGRHEISLAAARARADELATELQELLDGVRRDDVARAEQRVRVETLRARAVEELGLDADGLVGEYGPHRPVPADDPEDPPVPYDRAAQERRLRAAERALAQLGRVNPLALEEFTAFEERHRFLAEQLEDLRATRRDLLDIVRQVDERVQQAFAAAYEDTAREFATVFARLFPGGEGRLILTDPGDLLTTGVEVEARPAGKRISRLSLLSGGERSLAALALLVAIFKARPSPFYVLDEVEAALDDVNLGRLLVLLEELRASSQLLVITHQKRTMEIADALYGVTMRGDGVSAVVGQRLREVELPTPRVTAHR